jgi:hypothetical protein
MKNIGFSVGNDSYRAVGANTELADSSMGGTRGRPVIVLIRRISPIRE